MDIIFCVETAIRVGFDLGYKIVVPEDMVAGNARDKDANGRTFELIKKTYGVIVNSEDLLRVWSSYI